MANGTTHLVEVEAGVRPLAQRAVGVHERGGVAARLVVVQDVVADGRVRAQVWDEGHLTQALDPRLGVASGTRCIFGKQRL